MDNYNIAIKEDGAYAQILTSSIILLKKIESVLLDYGIALVVIKNENTPNNTFKLSYSSDLIQASSIDLKYVELLLNSLHHLCENSKKDVFYRNVAPKHNHTSIEDEINKEILESIRLITNIKKRITNLPPPIQEEIIKTNKIIDETIKLKKEISLNTINSKTLFLTLENHIAKNPFMAFNDKLKSKSKEEDQLIAHLTTFTNEFQKKIKSTEEESEERLAAYNNEQEKKIISLGNKLSLSHKKEIDKSNKYLERRIKEINELSGIISASELSNSYEDHAKTEAGKADRLRNISFLFMSFVFVMASYMFFTMPTAVEFKLDYMLSRLGLFFVLSIPAAYLSRESTKHRQQEVKFKQLSLDMKALSPFVAPMPEEQQIKIKTDIANRIFFTDQRQTNSNTTDSSPLDMNQVITSITTGIETALSTINLNKDKESKESTESEVPASKTTDEVQPAVEKPK